MKQISFLIIGFVIGIALYAIFISSTVEVTNSPLQSMPIEISSSKDEAECKAKIKEICGEYWYSYYDTESSTCSYVCMKTIKI